MQPKIILVIAGIAALGFIAWRSSSSKPKPARPSSAILTQVQAIMAGHLDAGGHLNIGAALLIAQLAKTLASSMPNEALWLNKLAKNIADALVGKPPENPEVVFGMYGV